MQTQDAMEMKRKQTKRKQKAENAKQGAAETIKREIDFERIKIDFDYNGEIKDWGASRNVRPHYVYTANEKDE